MAVESFKSDSLLLSTEDTMAMQRLKNSTVVPIGTVHDTTVTSICTDTQTVSAVLVIAAFRV